MSRHRDKLEASLGGIKDMGGRPDLIFIIDTNKEELAIKEAQRRMRDPAKKYFFLKQYKDRDFFLFFKK